MAVKNNNDGTYDIHGRTYKGVPLRVSEFCNDANYDGCSILTELIHQDDEKVIMKASIWDHNLNAPIGTGFAEEMRNASHINKTSALENCETSAIGRALSAVGLGGSEYASADEVINAIGQQGIQEALEPVMAHNKALAENLVSVLAIKEAVANDDALAAWETWAELSDDEKHGLWLAPTKGGIFTTDERKYIQSAKTQAAE